MPRCLTRNPRYSKHKASGQAVVTIEGRDFYLGLWNSKASKAEYDRIVGEWLSAGRRLPSSSCPIYVAELIERFWAHAKSYYRRLDGTCTQEVENFRAPLSFLNRLYGTETVNHFGPLSLETCRAEMIKRGWCRTNINRQVDRIKAVFKWGVAREIVPSSVYDALRCVAGLRPGRTNAPERPRVRPVPDDVVEATLPHLSNVVQAMVRVQRLTGARPAEICSMRANEIDRSKSEWTFKPTTHKNAHREIQRIIPLGPRAREILAPFLLQTEPSDYVFSPADAIHEIRQRRSEHRKTPLCCGNSPGTNRTRRPKRKASDHYDVAAYRRAIARAARAADIWAKGGKVNSDDERIIPHWHPHQLRHSAATEIRKRFGLEGAQHLLGHSSISMTELYAEKNANVAREIAAEIG